MSLKMYFLLSHMNFSPENCGALGDEQCQCFYRDISAKERKSN